MPDTPLESLRVLRPRAAASMIGLSLSTLTKMRLRGDGPCFVRLGNKSVGYPIADLRAWLDVRRDLSRGKGGAP